MRKLVRAKQGLSLDDDPYFGLINVKDDRERARLSEYDFYGHSGMELASEAYDELEIWGKIAETENIYSVAINGEQRKEAILMQRAKVSELSPTVLQLPEMTPQTQTMQTEPQKKKSWFRRG